MQIIVYGSLAVIFGGVPPCVLVVCLQPALRRRTLLASNGGYSPLQDVSSTTIKTCNGYIRLLISIVCLYIASQLVPMVNASLCYIPLYLHETCDSCFMFVCLFVCLFTVCRCPPRHSDEKTQTKNRRTDMMFCHDVILIHTPSTHAQWHGVSLAIFCVQKARSCLYVSLLCLGSKYIHRICTLYCTMEFASKFVYIPGENPGVAAAPKAPTDTAPPLATVPEDFEEET